MISLIGSLASTLCKDSLWAESTGRSDRNKDEIQGSLRYGGKSAAFGRDDAGGRASVERRRLSSLDRFSGVVLVLPYP
jgi:hypothetical protein